MHNRLKCNDNPAPQASNRLLSSLNNGVGPLKVPQPHCTYYYVDKVTIWLKCPLTEAEYKVLRKQCNGHLDRRWNGEFVQNKKSKYRIFFPDGTFVERLQLNQPERSALEWLNGRGGIHLSYLELSADWIFRTGSECDSAYEFACLYLIKKYRGRQHVRFYNKTRYTGARTVPNNCVIYNDKESKLTGEINTVHFDWRVRGAAALRRIGVFSVASILALDQAEFWKRRMIFTDMDIVHLGRLSNNKWLGSKRRRATALDRRVGQILTRAYGSTELGMSVQEIVDRLRGSLNVASSLRLIPVPLPPL
jgi:hypothetical protein